MVLGKGGCCRLLARYEKWGGRRRYLVEKWEGEEPYMNGFTAPPPPLPPLYLPMRLVDAISNYISSISAPPQPCARGHMFPPPPPPPPLARHWLVQVLCYFRPVARMTGGVGDRQRPPWLLMAPPTPSSSIPPDPPANGPEL